MIAKETTPERIEQLKKLLKFFETPEVLEALAQEYESYAKSNHSDEDDKEHSKRMSSALRHAVLKEDKDFYRILEIQEKERVDKMMAL